MTGFVNGYSFIEARNKEAELLQGRNYYLGVYQQWKEISILSCVITQIAKGIFGALAPASFTYIATVFTFTFLPFGLFCATVKQGNYQNLVNKIQGTVFECIFPSELGPKTTAICCFFAEHAGEMMQIAIVVSVIALAVLKQYAYVASFSLALSYRELHTRGWVHHTISLFVETYIMAVFNSGFLLLGEGSRLSKFLRVSHIISHSLDFVQFCDQLADARRS